MEQEAPANLIFFNEKMLIFAFYVVFSGLW